MSRIINYWYKCRYLKTILQTGSNRCQCIGTISIICRRRCSKIRRRLVDLSRIRAPKWIERERTTFRRCRNMKLNRCVAHFRPRKRGSWGHSIDVASRGLRPQTTVAPIGPLPHHRHDCYNWFLIRTEKNWTDYRATYEIVHFFPGFFSTVRNRNIHQSSGPWRRFSGRPRPPARPEDW